MEILYWAVLGGGLVAIFVVPRVRRRIAEKKLETGGDLQKALPRILIPGRGQRSILAETPTKKYKLSL
jgi:hypothetical protein